MIRGRVVGPLALGADDEAASNPHEPPDRMLLPTLDERASLYLRAVHGDRDFATEEQRGARDLILNAMAADVAARSGTRFPKQDDASLSHQGPAGVGFEHLTAFADAPLAIEALESDSIHHSGAFPYRRPPSAGRVPNRIAPVFVAAVLAAVAGYWMAGIFPNAWFAPDTQGPRVAGQASQPEPSGRKSPDPPIMAEVQREVASALNAAHLHPDEIAALLKHGQDLIADGKFRLARLVLGRAAEAGSAPAALALGQTYDPMLPERPGVRPDAPPDIAVARAWYERAKKLGSAEAAQRLSRLPAPLSAPAPRSNP